MAGAIRRALRFEKETPGAFAALQFENPANPDFHEETTAAEIWEQMEGRVDAWVSGVGSAGYVYRGGSVFEEETGWNSDCRSRAARQRTRRWGTGAA